MLSFVDTGGSEVEMEVAQEQQALTRDEMLSIPGVAEAVFAAIPDDWDPQMKVSQKLDMIKYWLQFGEEKK